MMTRLQFLMLAVLCLLCSTVIAEERVAHSRDLSESAEDKAGLFDFFQGDSSDEDADDDKNPGANQEEKADDYGLVDDFFDDYYRNDDEVIDDDHYSLDEVDPHGTTVTLEELQGEDVLPETEFKGGGEGEDASDEDAAGRNLRGM